MQQLGHQSCPACPSSDAFYRWEDGGGHCFSCGYHEHGDRVERFLLAVGREKNNDAVCTVPPDFEYWMPEAAREWISKYELKVSELAENRIGWSDTKQSLIFPVFGNKDDLLFYQARYFGSDVKHPKWVTKPASAHKDVIHLPKEHFKSETIVLVEDIISAIKVSRVENCTPLFGTFLPLSLALRLSKMFQRAVVWLDPDAKKKAVNTALVLSGGMKVDVVLSDKDPKDYSTTEIQEYLK